MRKPICLVLVLVMILALCAGCTGSDGTQTQAPAATEAAPVATEAPAAETTPEPEAPETEAPSMYPLAEHQTLTAISPIYAPRADWAVDSWDETPGYLAVAEATNITVEMNCLATEQFASSVKIMYSSGDLPDIVRDPATTIIGTIDDMIDNEVFIDLLPLLPEYAPDYYQYLEDTGLLADLTTPSGYIGYFYNIESEPALGLGGMIRQDWLDALNLETPRTYEEFHDALLAFKTEMGATEPAAIWPSVAATGEALASGFDISVQTTTGMYMSAGAYGFYQVDGEVKYGFLEPAFQDWVTLMHDWYADGLFASDFVSQNENPTADTYKSKIVDGTSGLIWSDRQYIDDLNANYDATVVPISDPRMTADQQLHFAGYKDTSAMAGFAITAACEKPEIAVQWCNYWYTDDGVILANFGIEGESYERDADGTYHYTDLVLNNPDGYTVAQTSYIYALNTGIVMTTERDSAMYSEACMNCVTVWKEGRDTAYHIPALAAMNVEESERYNAVFTDLNTFVCENLTKYVVGEESLDSLDSFVEELYTIGVQDCIDAWQSALDRYNAQHA